MFGLMTKSTYHAVDVIGLCINQLTS